MTHKSFPVVVVLVLSTVICGRLPAQTKTLSVKVSVQIDDESLEKQLESYFRRELRALGDIQLTEYDVADYVVALLGITDETMSGSKLGYSVTVDVHRHCLALKQLPEQVPTLFRLYETPDSAIVLQILSELMPLLSECHEKVWQKIASVGTEPDWLNLVRGWVAEIDSDFFEEHRRNQP